jgi:hypothetical protein
MIDVVIDNDKPVHAVAQDASDDRAMRVVQQRSNGFENRDMVASQFCFTEKLWLFETYKNMYVQLSRLNK